MDYIRSVHLYDKFRFRKVPGASNKSNTGNLDPNGQNSVQAEQYKATQAKKLHILFLPHPPHVLRMQAQIDSRAPKQMLMFCRHVPCHSSSV